MKIVGNDSYLILFKVFVNSHFIARYLAIIRFITARFTWHDESCAIAQIYSIIAQLSSYYQVKNYVMRHQHQENIRNIFTFLIDCFVSGKKWYSGKCHIILTCSSVPTFISSVKYSLSNFTNRYTLNYLKPSFWGISSDTPPVTL